MGSFKAVGLEKSYGIHTLFSHVNLETVIAYKFGGKKHSFLDKYYDNE